MTEKSTSEMGTDSITDDKLAHEQRKPSCDDAIFARMTQTKLQTTFYKLGKWIARRPLVSMSIGFFIMVSGVPATFVLPGEANLLWVKMAAGFEPFSLTTTEQFKDRQAANDLHDGFFVPSHGRNSAIIISPKHPSTMPVFSNAFMQAALPLVMQVYAMRVSSSDASYTFKDLCVPNGAMPISTVPASYSQCASAANDLFSAVRWNASEIPAAGSGVALYGVGAHDFAAPLNQLNTFLNAQGINASGVLRSLVGLREESALNFRFWDAQSLTIPFRLRDERRVPGSSRNELTDLWIKQLQSDVQSGQYVNSDTLRVTFLSDQSIGDGLQSLLNAFVPYLFLVFGVMGLYSEIFLFSQTRTNAGQATQILLVMQGLVVSGAAGFSGMGWILYLGQKDIVILCCMAVFLVMAVGVDCTFIFVSAMKAAGATLSVEEAMGHMLSEAATAVSLTTSSSVTCFLAAGLYGASQPAFLKFNLTMAVALFINYLGFIFYFSGCMALNEYRIAAGRADLRPWRESSKRQLPQWTNVAQKMRTLINEHFAPLFTESLLFKISGAAFMIASIVLAVVYIPSIGSGMKQTTFLIDSSPLYETWADFELLGGGKAAQTTTVQVSGLDLSSELALGHFKSDFVDEVQDRPETLSVLCLPVSYLFYRNTTQSTVLPWHSWLGTDQAAALLFGHSYYPLTAAANAASPDTIECSILYLNDVSSSDAGVRIGTMDAIYAITSRANARLAPLGASIRLNNFEWAINTSLDKASRSLCWQSIAVAVLAVGVVLLFSLPLRRASIAATNIFVVVVCVLGFVGYSGQSYHLLSLCVMAMGPGFCVDYTVEVMHFSNLGPSTERTGAKFTRGMRLCAFDVFHGCITGMLGVGCLMLCPGQAPRLFGNVTMVMIFYGGTYALWCLPATLTLLDDAFHALCNCGKQTRSST